MKAGNGLAPEGQWANFADVTLGAGIGGHSPECPPPNGFQACITPLVDGESAAEHYAAAMRPWSEGQTSDWFELDLGQDRDVHAVEIEWYDPSQAGTDFLLEAGIGEGWSTVVVESACPPDVVYRRQLASPVRARRWRFHLRRAAGQDRLLIRSFRLLGPGASPTRVLMLCPDCLGMDRRVLQQASSLREAGYRVTLLCGFECPREEHTVRSGIELHRYTYDWDDERLKRLRSRLPSNDRLRMLANRAFLFVANRFLRFNAYETFILERADRVPAEVVHVHDLPLLRLGVEVARRRGARLVYDAHEIYYEQECLPRRQQESLRRQEKEALPRVDVFTTVNSAIADYFQSHQGRRPLVLLNSIGTPPAGFDANSRGALRARAGLPAEATVVLYQGWFSAERNLTTLVLMAEHLPPSVFLCLIGYGEHEKDLRALVEGKPWAEKVRFLGRVDSDDLMPLTAGADVGVIPYQAVDLNHELCSPNKFFEFVQAGVPVVAQELVFFREMARRFGVVHTGDLSTPSSMARAVLDVLLDPSRLGQMKEGCVLAARELSWEVEAGKLLAAYSEMKAPR